ncbi:DUF2179 domain-containing protein [candidate division KSB3 bacterium]|uniref:DUF2179 domain-containing protein n=1 Tax=candidate division KSB3 bacterium TaxID=2044937 RepID=A0A9D5Q736_9BACT|nr:DUF2179 domain-containing protein [candidate division KSB3 bacterium]MBD3326023.1 DUF2179 domain-containing protein [candidate division KSB3 bacterium]
MHTMAVANRLFPKIWSVSSMSVLSNLALIAFGCILYTIGMKSVLIPNHWLAGGIAGFAIILHYWYESLNIGLSYFLMNVPLLILGWFHVSRRFMLYTTFGMIFFSFTANAIQPPVAEIDDPILAVVFAGVVCGIGGGLILRSLGSAGGFDIVGVYLNKQFGLRPGSVILATNSLALLFGVYLLGLEIILYSIAFLFISTRVMDSVVTGFNQRKSLLIISDQSEVIADHILHKVNRGVTFLKGEGAYSRREREIILTVTTLTELPKLKELIFSIDPQAFVVVNDTLEVLGKRHGTLKIY